MGRDSDARVSHWFGGPNCTEEFSNNYLAVYATSKGWNSTDPLDRTMSEFHSFFCKPSYEIEQMSVTVKASNGAIIEAKSLPTPVFSSKNISDVFNTTLFEYLIGNGINPLIDSYVYSGTKRATDLPNLLTVEQYSRTKDIPIVWPLTNMAPFAMGLNNLPLEDLADPENLRRTFEKAHQLLFATAISTLSREYPNGQFSMITDGLKHDRPAAIVIVRTICIIVEVVLGIVALLALALYVVTKRRLSSLQYNPASIADLMSMIPPDASLAKDMQDDGTVTIAVLDEMLYGKAYRLRTGRNIPSTIQAVTESTSVTLVKPSKPDRVVTEPFKPVRSWEHRLVTGFSFTSFIGVALAALIFLHEWSTRHDGKLIS